jgi:hypothetical protein
MTSKEQKILRINAIITGWIDTGRADLIRELAGTIPEKPELSALLHELADIVEEEAANADL